MQQMGFTRPHQKIQMNLSLPYRYYREKICSDVLKISHLKINATPTPPIYYWSAWSSPRSWTPRCLDLAQMVMDIRKQLKIIAFITPNQFCINNIAIKSFPGTSIAQDAAGPHPDGHGHPEITWNNCVHHFQNLLYQRHCQKVIP